MAADGIPLGTRKQHYPRDSTQKRNIIKVMLQFPSYGWKKKQYAYERHLDLLD